LGFKLFSDYAFGLRTLINNELYRTFGIPAQRTGFGGLYINKIFYGLYLTIEEMDLPFIKSRYNSIKGNFYKMRRGRFHYLGRDEGPYKNCGGTERCYDQVFGNRSWSDIAIASTLLDKNITNEIDFEKLFPTIFDVERLLR
jgi:hypothetical protein